MQFILSIIVMLFQFIPFTTPQTQQLGTQLAHEVVYIAAELPCGNATVLVAIDMDEPQFMQLYSPAVLRAFSREVEQLQRDFLPAGEPYLLMCARHIAGETKLHLIGYAATTLLGGERGLLPGLHERFRVIDLNVDEDRVPWWLLHGTGWAIVG